MNKVTSFLLGAVVLTAVPVFAEPMPAAEQSQVQLVEVGNKTCPVSHEKVGDMGPAVKFVYNGKIYNLCCPMCRKDFQDNPEKFSKIAEDDAAANGQYQGR